MASWKARTELDCDENVFCEKDGNRFGRLLANYKALLTEVAAARDALKKELAAALEGTRP